MDAQLWKSKGILLEGYAHAMACALQGSLLVPRWEELTVDAKKLSARTTREADFHCGLLSLQDGTFSAI